MAHSTYGRVGTDRCLTQITLLLASVVLVGCGGQDEVRHYKVPKPDRLFAQNHVDLKPATAQADEVPTEPTDRLLGAIVPRSARTWYFKMAGPMALVAQQEQAFRDLVASLTFDGPDTDPKWTLPPSWQEDEGTGQRLATLSVEIEGQKLEVSVIQLATGSSATSILDNVNRWRLQMRLPMLDAAELEQRTTKLELAEGTAVLVNEVGNFSSGSMGSGVLTQPRINLAPKPVPEPTPPATPAGLKYDTPAGWTPQPAAMFSVLNLGLTDGDRSVQISVSPLQGGGGGLLANVNRWYRQAGLPGITEEELPEQTEPLQVGGITGTYAEVIGDASQADHKAIIGWIGAQGAQSWFVKISGNPQMVVDQRETFRNFLKTLEFNAP